MSIYRKPIETITWADIEAFCKEGVAENSFVDYKEDFPKDLAKTIAAMANTLGGVILIGVEEDKSTGKPVVPLKGIDFEPRLAEKVFSLSVDGIYPPAIPDVQVCSNSTNDRALVVIRVHQSHQSPHAILKNTSVYVRTGNRSKPEDLTDIDHIEWLLDQRRKSVEFAEEMKKRAMIRSEKILKKNRSDVGNAKSPHEYEVGKMILTVSLVPSYPKHVLLTPSELNNKANLFRSKGSTSSLFPNLLNSQFLQDGLLFFEKDLRDAVVEINGFGFYQYRQFISHFHKSSKTDILILSNLAATLNDILKSAMVLYLELGYWGPILIELKLEGIENGLFKLTSGLFNSHTSTFQSEINFRETTLAKLLQENRLEFLAQILRQVGWGINLDLSESSLKSCLKEAGICS